MPAEKWFELVAKLNRLHRVRKEMSYASIYHGSYENLCIEINQKLVELTGKNYSSYTMEERQRADELTNKTAT